MALFFPAIGNAAELMGRRPLALGPEQWGRHLAGCGQADGGGGRGLGGPPHHLFRCPPPGKMNWHGIEAHP